jgi:hypothetical protein
MHPRAAFVIAVRGLYSWEGRKRGCRARPTEARRAGQCMSIRGALSRTRSHDILLCELLQEPMHRRFRDSRCCGESCHPNRMLLHPAGRRPTMHPISPNSRGDDSHLSMDTGVENEPNMSHLRDRRCAQPRSGLTWSPDERNPFFELPPNASACLGARDVDFQRI